ncbi:MAG: arabinosidase [Chitinophagaceae bacterium BSSC1]|nr:MAG: arabinosidase [Chitinophagaceae bacterium BSSC1]
MSQKPLHIIFLGCLIFIQCSCKQSYYVFSSFQEPANKGLETLISKDGYHWKRIDSVLLKPMIGKDKIMRDPSILQGPDGLFHLVWTTEWKGGNGFGYASSKDLLHWSEQQYIPVMQSEPTVVNVWAPELFYDQNKASYIIVWASCIPNRFAKGIEEENNNHRLYYTLTKDFKTFSETKLFLDPGFSAIDAVLVQKSSDEIALVLKDNTRPERDLKMAFGTDALGPFTAASASFTQKFTEGPAVAKLKQGWLIYFDAYQEKKFGAVYTRDFKSFQSADSLISVPTGHKHGTIIRVDKHYLKSLLAINDK